MTHSDEVRSVGGLDVDIQEREELQGRSGQERDRDFVLKGQRLHECEHEEPYPPLGAEDQRHDRGPEVPRHEPQHKHHGADQVGPRASEERGSALAATDLSQNWRGAERQPNGDETVAKRQPTTRQ
jgi:hypothetical protein